MLKKKSYHKRQIGDKIVIKSLQWYDSLLRNGEAWVYYKDEGGGSGGTLFSENRTKYCGMSATITEYNDFNSYKIDIDGGKYEWMDCMFEDYLPEEIKYIEEQTKDKSEKFINNTNALKAYRNNVEVLLTEQFHQYIEFKNIDEKEISFNFNNKHYKITIDTKKYLDTDNIDDVELVASGDFLLDGKMIKTLTDSSILKKLKTLISSCYQKLTDNF